MVNRFSGNSDSDEKTLRPILTTLRGPLRSAVGPVPETDTNVASQFSYTKVFPSGGSFQDVWGEWIWVGQNRSVQRPPLSLTLCGQCFAFPQTSTFAVILHCPVTLRSSSLPDCWQWTHRSFKCHFLQQNVLYSQLSLPFTSSYVFGFPLLH